MAWPRPGSGSPGGAAPVAPADAAAAGDCREARARALPQTYI